MGCHPASLSPEYALFNTLANYNEHIFQLLVLEQQLDIMKAYIAVLEERAKIEGVNVR